METLEGGEVTLRSDQLMVKDVEEGVDQGNESKEIKSQGVEEVKWKKERHVIRRPLPETRSSEITSP